MSPVQVRTGIADEKAAALYALGMFGKCCGKSFSRHIEQALQFACSALSGALADQ
jgi:hypothetical protein